MKGLFAASEDQSRSMKASHFNAPSLCVCGVASMVWRHPYAIDAISTFGRGATRMPPVAPEPPRMGKNQCA